MNQEVHYPVLVHSCDFDLVVTREQVQKAFRYVEIIDNEEEKKKGRPKRLFRQLVETCSCRHFVTYHDAIKFLRTGTADKIWTFERKGHLAEDINSIWMTQQVMVPRIDLVTKAHIERAYTHSDPAIRKEAMEYIEEIHTMFQNNLKALIVPYRPDPYEGRCLFPFGPDERTEGGHE